MKSHQMLMTPLRGSWWLDPRVLREGPRPTFLQRASIARRSTWPARQSGLATGASRQAKRLAVLTSNTRSEAGRACERKIMLEKWPLAPSILTTICIQVKLVVFRIPTPAVADPRLTESCARSPKLPTSIKGRERPIPCSHSSSTCKELQFIPYPNPRATLSTSISQPHYSLPTSLLPSTIALSPTRYPCPLRLEHRPCSIWSCRRKETKSSDSSPSCEPSIEKRLIIHRSCEVVKAHTAQCHR